MRNQSFIRPPISHIIMDIAGATKFLISGKEGMIVSVRERILTIRLMEKVNARPAYAEAFGIVAQNGLAEPKRQTAQNSAEHKS